MKIKKMISVGSTFPFFNALADQKAPSTYERYSDSRALRWRWNSSV